MADLIDRQALLEEVRNDIRRGCFDQQTVIDNIEYAPTVETECGTWIERIDETHFCSNCGDDALWDMESKQEYLSSYCPTCGKRMTKVKSYGEDVADNG